VANKNGKSYCKLYLIIIKKKKRKGLFLSHMTINATPFHISSNNNVAD